MMITSTTSRNFSSERRAENSDAAGLIVALLVRFPEIATLASRPADRSVELSFVIDRAVGRDERRVVRELVVDHIRSLVELRGEQPALLAVRWESEGRITFLRLARDADTLSREELAMAALVLSQRFGDHLVRELAVDDGADIDLMAQDELVEYALDSLRDPQSQRGLVGMREEKRVVVYFHPARKKAKGSARS